MKILVFGHKGQLGIDLIQYAEKREIEVVGSDLPDYDITSKKSVNQAFADAGHVNAVINTAAYTAVDLAETHPEIAFSVNRDGAANLAEACRQRQIPLIHISTDYVFNGQQIRPYRPNDIVDPMGVYAQSKAAGEEAVRGLLDRHVIVRTSWLVGRYGNNFVKTMLRLGKEREEIQVVDDQIGSPTYAGDLAEALIKVAEKLSEGFTGWGTYHYCNKGALTWYAFARKIFALSRPYEKLAVNNVVSILTEKYPLPAPRPQYSVLDCTSFDETFGIPRRPWDDALRDMLAGLYSTMQRRE